MLLLQGLIFLLGLYMGSFLNLCIYRIPEGKSIIYPPSYCPSCKHKLSPIDLIPLIGYLINRGSCKYCADRIPKQYPLVELLTGIVFLLLFNKFLFTIEMLKYSILVCLLIAITFVDLERQEIPDEFIVFGLITGLLFSLYNFKADMFPGILGFLLGGGSFLVIAAITGGAMGGGDIKLMAVLGLFFGWKLILLISLLSFIIGGIVSLILVAARVKGRKDYIPFGPFIAVAAVIAIFYGSYIMNLYYINL